ncbi:hydrolase 76 protein [Orbilia brochopaga]|uniref:Mannan endo-1,6-alpha-mannosidase n=1 Tax=Orbilia brochopaga TaxID=3140254 RepID=A0AAV9V0V4_9PEZI
MRLATFSSAALLLAAQVASAIELDVDSYDSIKAAAKIVARDLANGFWDPYSVAGVPFPTYYWWLHGAILGAMVDYWAFTGDDTYNANVTVGWLRGVSPSLDLQPDEQSFSEGNDDQGFWSIMSMDATERVFPETDAQKDMNAGFLEITQTVQNLQAARWDNTTCGGGLRWQINPANSGYLYKNTISNGLFFQMNARLAKYTKNATYANWADTTYKWLRKTKIIADDYHINDGASIPDCTKFSVERWTYNYGTLLAGCAAMYNFTNKDPYWKDQVDNILKATYATFFDDATGAIKEIQCQDSNTCNSDQPSFKAYLARWMGYTAQVAPYTYDDIMPRLRKNAQLAAATCTGQPGGTACGLKWNIGAQWDGKYGLGEQLSALEVIQNTAPFVAPRGAGAGAVVDKEQGTSRSNPGAMGTRGGVHNRNSQYLPYRLPTYTITNTDRAGAAIITLLVIAGVSFGARFTMIH